MDHAAAYLVALATVRALHRRERTGEGAYVDMAQAGSALFLTGTAALDHSANGRESVRVGNGSPHRPACPHGAYPCAGSDRWIAIAVFSDDEWERLAHAMGAPGWTRAEHLRTLDGRLDAHEQVDAGLAEWTRSQDAYEAMELLQAAGVRAGVCQTGRDRAERDVQLQARDYYVQLPHSEIGPWPVENVPFRMTETPCQVGMSTGRASPCYGEDTADVLHELLGLSLSEISALEDEGVIGDGKSRSGVSADAAS
jgi:crotonobetainyl-CoA:carnitine CoA-transferase CaiB-like acyl-CoA transferase